MKRKKVMFIGAGKYQLQGIIKAKEMGLYVIATDGSSMAPGLRLADMSYVIDVKNIEANLEVAKKNSIDGVLCVASDVSLKTVAVIAKELGLPGIGIDVAERSTDKELMRKSFVKGGVPSPKSFTVYNYEELLKKVDEVGYPAVIKPADNAGSRGVKMVTKQGDLGDAYEKAMENSRSKKVVIEEYMEGVEVSVEAFVYQGKINIIALSDKVRSAPPYLLDVEVIFPSAYSDEVKREIINVAKKAIKAIGIEMGPVHIEIMITKNGPIPVELAARGPGFKVFTDILPMITGIDILEALIKVSLGEEPNLVHKRNLASVIKFFDASEGVVKEIIGIDEIKKIDGIYEIDIYVKVGDRVKVLTCGSDRIGHVISLAESRDKAIEIVKEAEKRLRVVIS